MARTVPAFFLACIVISGALGLGSCQNLPNPLDSLAGRMPMDKAPIPPASPPPMVRATPAVLPPMAMVSEGMKEDHSRITALEADNARLKNQLAGALKENAKLKRDLADAVDDNALLKDLAAKRQR